MPILIHMFILFLNDAYCSVTYCTITFDVFISCTVSWNLKHSLFICLLLLHVFKSMKYFTHSISSNLTYFFYLSYTTIPTVISTPFGAQIFPLTWLKKILIFFCYWILIVLFLKRMKKIYHSNISYNHYLFSYTNLQLLPSVNVKLPLSTKKVYFISASFAVEILILFPEIIS